MNATKILAILDRAEQLISPEAVSDAYDRLASRLTARFDKSRPVLVSVLNGGLLFASELMRRCDFPLELDTIRVSRYHDNVRGQALEWHVRPSASLRARHVVLLDDVIDIGKTLAYVKDEIARDEPTSISTAVLVKKNIRQPETHADYVGLKLPDRFLVGEGMDFAGYGRNKKGIWALKLEDEMALSEAS